MPKVLSALRKLKEIHSEYKDIFINTALSEEEMFNEHEQSANDFSAPEEMDIESNDLNENTEEQSNENEHEDSRDDTENTAEEQSRVVMHDHDFSWPIPIPIFFEQTGRFRFRYRFFFL